MVDFRKRTGKGAGSKPVDPVEIYDGLDRASDKGPLRPAQTAVLKAWHAGRRNFKDTILKLHTGQGKTLIGLLMLQSKLHEGKGPALYLCPNNFLIEQTCEQAQQFGLKVVTPDEDGGLPGEFLESKTILVTSIQKLFNGLTKFGLDARSIQVTSIVLDDAHACIDSIREACTITISQDIGAYIEIRDLFASDLRSQGAGTYADIVRNEWEALLPVPYWAWLDKADEVVQILSRYTDNKEIRFRWPLLKDALEHCHCLVHGKGLEIHPHLPPLHKFGSYHKAECRIFMSATVTDDSFLVKGLGLDASVIREPLVYEKERWSGEKMILIPSLIDPTLDRSSIVKAFAPPGRRSVGVVALCPGDAETEDWGKYGSIICTKADIYESVNSLKQGNYDRTLVLSNRYDGIDLPDNACRVLIVDSRPYADSARDRYMERCLGNADAIATKVARKIEQGLGRSVRGEKDYCVILLIGSDLVAQIKSPSLRKHFSPQTRLQVEMGLELATFAREDAKDETPVQLLYGLLGQCLRRDEGWKAFYVERMSSLDVSAAPPSERLQVYEAELRAEQRYQNGMYEEAALIAIQVADKLVTDEGEKAWYLQEAARYYYRASKVESRKYQRIAHSRNRYLLWQQDGASVVKMAPLAQQRVENVIEWLKGFANADEMLVAVDGVLTPLSFGIAAERFEAALDQLGRMLGFATERPAKEWKQGPDNLWCLRQGYYVLFECKSGVEATRAVITGYEADQINSSVAWFRKVYSETDLLSVLIHPAKKLSTASRFISDTMIMRKRKLDLLVKNVRAFFAEFRNIDLRSIDQQRVNAALEAHGLSIERLIEDYVERPMIVGAD